MQACVVCATHLPSKTCGTTSGVMMAATSRRPGVGVKTTTGTVVTAPNPDTAVGYDWSFERVPDSTQCLRGRWKNTVLNVCAQANGAYVTTAPCDANVAAQDFYGEYDSERFLMRVHHNGKCVRFNDNGKREAVYLDSCSKTDTRFTYVVD